MIKSYWFKGGIISIVSVLLYWSVYSTVFYIAIWNGISDQLFKILENIFSIPNLIFIKPVEYAVDYSGSDGPLIPFIIWFIYTFSLGAFVGSIYGKFKNRKI